MHACYDLKKDVYIILAQVDSEFIAGAKTLNTNVPESKWVLKRQKIYINGKYVHIFFDFEESRVPGRFSLSQKREISTLNKRCSQKQVKPFIF